MHVRGVARTDGRVLHEATALVDAGYVVSIVDRDDEGPHKREDFCRVQLVHSSFSTSPLSSFISRFRAFSLVHRLVSHLSCTRLLVQLSADIYHAHDVSALPACFLAALLRRKPLIFDAHELPLSELDGTSWQWLKKPLTHGLSILIRYCTGVITVSPPIAREIRTAYRISEVSLVRNVPSYQRISRGNLLRQHLGLDTEVRIALYHGNLQADRGLDRLIRAARFLEPNIVIVLMGKGIGSTLAQLEALIAQEDVANRVKVIPPVPYAELLHWAASADLGLIVYTPQQSLNVQMCLPNKLFEYLMAGLPVLASPLDAVVKVLDTYKVGQVVPSLDPLEVASAINALLADSAALAEMRHNALAAANGDLCWEKECQHLLQLYHRITGICRPAMMNFPNPNRQSDPCSGA